MAQGWLSRVGTRLRRALLWKPRTWRELVATLVVGSLFVLVLSELLNRVEMLRSPGPPLLLIAAICGVQVYDFVRRRRRERASTREAAQESQRPGAG